MTEISGPRIVLEFKNKKPLDVLELTNSLRAFATEYKRFASTHYPEGTRARLAVGALDTGSVIAQLVPILELADIILGHRDYVGPFVAQFGDTMNLIKSFPPKARDIPKPEVRAAKEVVKPIASDEGGQLNIYAAEGATITTNIYNIGTNGARDLRKHADIILAGVASDQQFHSEPMVLFQMRDGPATAAGDYGFIDRFSDAPVRIRWLSEEAKAAVLDRPENVFDMVYFVTGSAKTAGGQVVVYDIRRLDDAIPKPPQQRHG